MPKYQLKTGEIVEVGSPELNPELMAKYTAEGAVPITDPPTLEKPAPQPVPQPAPSPAQPTAQPQGQPEAQVQTYTVQKGDTLSAIAQRYGTTVQDISGFKSGNPDVIFPGEVLSVRKGAAQPAQPQGQPAPQPAQQPTQPQAQSTQPEPQPSPTPGATPDLFPAPDAQFGDFLMKNYGFDIRSFDFFTNPQKGIKDIIKEVMDATGLPDAKKRVEDYTKEIESLENERNEKIAAINDNPWYDESQRSKRVNQIKDQYEQKIDARVNRLKLMQDTYDDARQEAQFAATTAIGLYDKERAFEQGRVEFLMERAEKALEARNKLDGKEEKRSAIYQEYLDAKKEGYAGSFTQYQNEDVNRKRTVINIPGGGITQAIIENPSLFDDLTPTVKGSVIRELQAQGYDTSNLGVKGLSDKAIADIVQTQKALADLGELKTIVQNNQQFIGPISGVQRLNPYSKARQVQADVNRVRQTVGKALEGGVLRKEDEDKYKKILATLSDTPSTATYKIDALIGSIQRDIENYKALQQAGGRSMNIREGLQKKGTKAPDPAQYRAKYNY